MCCSSISFWGSRFLGRIALRCCCCCFALFVAGDGFLSGLADGSVVSVVVGAVVSDGVELLSEVGDEDGFLLPVDGAEP